MPASLQTRIHGKIPNKNTTPVLRIGLSHSLLPQLFLQVFQVIRRLIISNQGHFQADAEALPEEDGGWFLCWCLCLFHWDGSYVKNVLLAGSLQQRRSYPWGLPIVGVLSCSFSEACCLLLWLSFRSTWTIRGLERWRTEFVMFSLVGTIYKGPMVV